MNEKEREADRLRRIAKRKVLRSIAEGDLLRRIARELKPHRKPFSMKKLEKRCLEVAEEYQKWREWWLKAKTANSPRFRDRLLDIAERNRDCAEWLDAFDFDEFRELVGQLKQAADTAERIAEATKIVRARNTTDKLACACYAWMIANQFSEGKPALTLEYIELSSLFYELCTGIEDKKFDDSCRSALEIIREKFGAFTEEWGQDDQFLADLTMI
jgi:hypothetical protein